MNVVGKLNQNFMSKEALKQKFKSKGCLVEVTSSDPT